MKTKKVYLVEHSLGKGQPEYTSSFDTQRERAKFVAELKRGARAWGYNKPRFRLWTSERRVK